MDCSWIDVVDTAVKIGLGALISAISGYVVLVKTQWYSKEKEDSERFYKHQEEKKSKYVELLSQSQELIQTFLYESASPDSEEYKMYLRVFNEVQIISSDEVRKSAFNLMSSVSSFMFLRKNEQEVEIIDGMVKSAHENVSFFQKIAQSEATKVYKKT